MPRCRSATPTPCRSVPGLRSLPRRGGATAGGRAGDRRDEGRYRGGHVPDPQRRSTASASGTTTRPTTRCSPSASRRSRSIRVCSATAPPAPSTTASRRPSRTRRAGTTSPCSPSATTSPPWNYTTCSTLRCPTIPTSSTSTATSPVADSRYFDGGLVVRSLRSLSPRAACVSSLALPSPRVFTERRHGFREAHRN